MRNGIKTAILCIGYGLLTIICNLSTVSYAATTPSTFLVVSDIHFDPFLSCNRVRPCPLIQKLRQAPVERWEAILAANDKGAPHYGFNTNIVLWQSTVEELKHVAQITSPSFVFILGDFLGHKFNRYYRIYSGDKSGQGYTEFVYKTLLFMNNAFNQIFPHTDVYAVVGNNDTYNRDYMLSPRGAFFKDMAESWSQLIKNPENKKAMQAQFPVAGYYAVNAPSTPGLRLIVLNTNLFSYKVKGKGVDQAAEAELEWFAKQLADVKAHQQKAYIALHIPPDIDVYATPTIKLFTLFHLWNTTYSKTFQQILQSFTPQIAGIFAGHLHTDWLHVWQYPNDTTLTVMGNPSISPVYGNNPGFKVYTFSSTTMQIENYTTYSYPLASREGWGMGYGSNQTLQRNCYLCRPEKEEDPITPWFSIYHLLFDTYSKATPTLAIGQWSAHYWCPLGMASQKIVGCQD